jgi:hypothetical protein
VTNPALPQFTTMVLQRGWAARATPRCGRKVYTNHGFRHGRATRLDDGAHFPCFPSTVEVEKAKMVRMVPKSPTVPVPITIIIAVVHSNFAIRPYRPRQCRDYVISLYSYAMTRPV